MSKITAAKPIIINSTVQRMEWVGADWFQRRNAVKRSGTGSPAAESECCSLGQSGLSKRKGTAKGLFPSRMLVIKSQNAPGVLKCYSLQM